MNQRIVVSQAVTTLKELRELKEEFNELTLVAELTQEEKEELCKNETPSKNNLGYLYNVDACIKSDHETYYAFLNADSVRQLIEQRKIYIPLYIDANGKEKYIDYFYKSYSLDYRDGIVFRDKKRLFEKRQAAYSLNRNSIKIVPIEMAWARQNGFAPGFLPPQHSSNKEEIFTLCMEAIKVHEARVKRKKELQKKYSAKRFM